MHTHDASGIIHIEATDQNAAYTLGQFFALWRATHGTVTINGVSHPVSYTGDELLGRRADSTHTIRLMVDGKQSNEGPRLVLTRLDYCAAKDNTPPCSPTAVGDPFPASITRQYGTGHTIVLEYATTPAQ